MERSDFKSILKIVLITSFKNHKNSFYHHYSAVGSTRIRLEWNALC